MATHRAPRVTESSSPTRCYANRVSLASKRDSQAFHKKYPMVLRAGWLPHEIRNASGCGGGKLIGYMVMIPDPSTYNSRTEVEKVAFTTFKRDIYQKVLNIVFNSVKIRSKPGEAITCGDGKIRICHPGIVIESQDEEEAANFTGCRHASALVPCPTCLCVKELLHDITGNFVMRTTAQMKEVYERASAARTKTEKEEILKKSGLHDVKHFMWDFAYSDPYRAVSYDTLHSDDIGKWGKHLWPLLLTVIEDRRQSGLLTERMDAFPRWSNLKHFNSVAATNFTDGQSYFDILKCILPCIVDLLPKNCSLIQCIRTYTRYRLLLSLKCMTNTRIEYLRNVIVDYKRACEEYGKNFDFLKQHAADHVIQDIEEKGTTINYSTRPGEGFQQEADQEYNHTNGKHAEHQVSVIRDISW